MPRKKLTEEGVAKLKAPATGSIDYYDAHMPGLILRLNAGGTKSWRALFYVTTVAKNGKRAGQRIRMPTTHNLGRYPVLKLKEAREAARTFLSNPTKALAEADTGSFQEVAENFVKRHVIPSKLRSQADIERLLKTRIYPQWANRPFRDIKRGDVAALLDHIEDNHGKRQADVCLAIISKMANWYAARNNDYMTPVVRGMKRRKTDNNAPKRFLDDDEIRAVWTACADMGSFGALVKILLLTGQRREKVATMKWDDVVDGEWRIAREAREKANAGHLRLPQMARDIIAAQPRIADNPYVFAAAVGKGPFNSFSQRKAELDKALPRVKPWVIHDLRRTCRKLLTRAHVRADVAELVLGHSIKGIQAVYDQREEYQSMVDDAVQRVANEVDRILNPPAPNVVQLRQ